jgi:hypothetical protein
METRKPLKPRVHTKQTKLGEQPTAIDVTCVIGTVQLTDDESAMTANEAAFAMIARHDRPGTYNFPGVAGTITVTVEHESAAQIN